MSVQPETAQALVDTIFMFGRSLRAAVTTGADSLLPPALVSVLFMLAARGSADRTNWPSICVSVSRRSADKCRIWSTLGMSREIPIRLTSGRSASEYRKRDTTFYGEPRSGVRRVCATCSKTGARKRPWPQ